MKKLIFVTTLFAGSTAIFAAVPPDVNQKVLKSFEQTFKNPTDVTWHEFPNYYEVDFKQDEVKEEVRYDSEGDITSYIRYYFENNLPPHILSRLKTKYPERSVFGVTEIFSNDDLEYYITMEDEKNWYTVKSSPVGLMEQTEKYRKAPTK